MAAFCLRACSLQNTEIINLLLSARSAWPSALPWDSTLKKCDPLGNSGSYRTIIQASFWKNSLKAQDRAPPQEPENSSKPQNLPVREKQCSFFPTGSRSSQLLGQSSPRLHNIILQTYPIGPLYFPNDLSYCNQIYMYQGWIYFF